MVSAVEAVRGAMAKPGELADVISRLFGGELSTVRQQARELRDQGLMAKEKAGRGAGSVSTRDAAHLLLAAASTTSVRKSPRVIERPGQFISRGKWDLEFLPIRELKKLGARHSLVDAVDALIEAAMNSSVADSQDIDVEVTIAGPVPSASIAIGVLTRDENGSPAEDPAEMEVHHYDRRLSDGKGNLAGYVLPNADERDVDLRTQFRFTHATITAIANLLRS